MGNAEDPELNSGVANFLAVPQLGLALLERYPELRFRLNGEIVDLNMSRPAS